MTNAEKLEQSKLLATQAAIQYRKNHPEIDNPKSNPSKYYQYTDISTPVQQVAKPVSSKVTNTSLPAEIPPLPIAAIPLKSSIPSISSIPISDRIVDAAKSAGEHLTSNASIYGGVAAAGLGAYALHKYLKKKKLEKEMGTDNTKDVPDTEPVVKNQNTKFSVKKPKIKKQTTAFYNTKDIDKW